MSADNKTRFHLPDGQEQRRRDAQMAHGSTDWSFNAIAWIYQHDAAAAQPRQPAFTPSAPTRSRGP
jgi:salicylate hydroxylase